MRIPNLLSSDETAIHRLSERLTDETLLHGTGIDQIENCPQRTGKLEALCRLNVACGQVGIVKYEDAGNITVAPEIHRNAHVEFRRTQIRQIVKIKRRLVAVHTLDFLVPVPGPQSPKDEVRPISRRKQSEPVDPPVLADPVPYLDMIGVSVLSEAGCLGLLGGEEPLLLFSELEETPRRFTVRLSHNTILQLS